MEQFYFQIKKVLSQSNLSIESMSNETERIKVTQMGGEVVIIPQDKMPSSTGLAAIYRY